MDKQFVAILMGSESDLPIMQECIVVLKSLGLEYEVKITSAHRTPSRTLDYVMLAQQRGCEVFICAAGMAAHLAGVVAAHTLKPVIGVPLNSGALQGFDALLSTVQMPPGVPVATVAIGKPGAKNAAFLAAQILALKNQAVLDRLMQARSAQAEQIALRGEQLDQVLEV